MTPTSLNNSSSGRRDSLRSATAAPNLVQFAEIRITPIKGWQQFLREGQQFLRTATRAYQRKRQAFTPEILYNLVAMAIEKLIMAQLMAHGKLPYNHTMHDLVEAMEEFLPGTLAGLGEKLKSLDAFQEICDTEQYVIKVPGQGDIEHMLTLGQKLEQLTIARTSARTST